MSEQNSAGGQAVQRRASWSRISTLGIAYLNEKPDALLTRIFIQGGGAIDFSSTTPDRLYLCWSIGTFFRLYRFGA